MRGCQDYRRSMVISYNVTNGNQPPRHHGSQRRSNKKLHPLKSAQPWRPRRRSSAGRRFPGPPPAAAGRPTRESTLIGVPPVPGSTRYALPGARAAQPLVHAHTAVLHVSTQSAAPAAAWELLTMLLEPETLYSYTHLRWAVPPRKSILGRGLSAEREHAANG